MDNISNRKNKYMARAIELANYAAQLGEIPIGAVVVNKTSGEIVGEGYNRRECDKSPIAHAEIIAIEAASKKLGGWRLIDCDLYVTLEPCPMCCGAIINSRISTVYFGAYDKKAGSVCSVQEMFSFPYNHKAEVFGGIMQQECAELLSKFFMELRNKKNSTL